MENEPSETLKAHPYLMRCLELGLSIHECEKQARVADHLKKALSSTPFYAQRAAEDPEYWSKLADGAPNLLGRS